MKLSKQRKNKLSEIFCKKSNLASESNHIIYYKKFNLVTINIGLVIPQI